MFKRLKDETGYSLVEVLASIVIPTAAIIPMVGMFDMGLNAATRGSNYDKARTLANLKLEQAKTLPYATVKATFPENTGTTTNYNGSGKHKSAWKTESGAASADFTGFEYRVEKQYLAQPPTNPATGTTSANFGNSSTDAGLIKVIIEVQWGDGSTEYTTSGLVAQ